jgi:predicted nucleic acid-binding protein
MAFLVDTNLLLRSAEVGHPMHDEAVSAVEMARQEGEPVYVTPQNLIEFWAVATRPVERNGLGFTIEQSDSELLRLQTLFPVLPESPAIYPEWHRLVVTYRVAGHRMYDARLVASMIAYGVDRLLTFNVDDFRRYGEIHVVHPSDMRPPAVSP